jgi:transposase-like protein
MKKSRRKFSADFKAKIAIEAIKEMKTVSELAQIHQVHPNLISLWKKEFLANTSRVFEGNKDEAEEINRLKKEHSE